MLIFKKKKRKKKRGKKDKSYLSFTLCNILLRADTSFSTKPECETYFFPNEDPKPIAQ